MRTLKSTVSAAGLVIVGAVAMAAPSTAAPNTHGPSENSSCLARVFVAQATISPKTVAERIAYIKAVELAEGESFGNVIGGWFAHWDDC
jgi:hypothetical protein